MPAPFCSVSQVFLGVYLLAPRTAVEHGRRVPARDITRETEGCGEAAEGLMEEGEADLRKMLKLEGEEGAWFLGSSLLDWYHCHVVFLRANVCVSRRVKTRTHVFSWLL